MRYAFFSVALFASIVLSLSCDQEDSSDISVFTYCMKRWSTYIHIDNRIDILFIIDNSRTVAGKQAQIVSAIEYFALVVGDKFGSGHFHVAVITTGMESDACPHCDSNIVDSCLNETGESGRFQDRLGHITWSGGEPVFDFIRDTDCRVVTSENLDCFYDEAEERGTALVGTSGCPYRRGLAAMRQALGSDLWNSYNAGFIREDAPLAVIFISDGEDCGEPGDVSEGIPGVGEKICSYAAKGVGPDGSTFHPDDPDRKPYLLTPVEEYYDFLLELKDNREGMVKFAAIVGVNDFEGPAGTTIEYESSDPNAGVLPVCSVPECTGGNCEALPGTRAIQLAQMFGIGNNGMVDTICQEDFSNRMINLGNFVVCPREFRLAEKPLDPALVGILINEEQVPRYSCSITDRFEECSGPGDTSCSQGSCVATWIYCRLGDPSPQCSYMDYTNAPGGVIIFADHFDPCNPDREHPIVLHIEFVYATSCY